MSLLNTSPVILIEGKVYSFTPNSYFPVTTVTKKNRTFYREVYSCGSKHAEVLFVADANGNYTQLYSFTIDKTDYLPISMLLTKPVTQKPVAITVCKKDNPQEYNSYNVDFTF